ncbi:HNH endonuclease [Microbulbifer sp. JTAC008]|uniref:HNH endonuclease n=1 Tax=unclassified Microbulbifer TaxID=2619833 RepID=UPI00403935A1
MQLRVENKQGIQYEVRVGWTYPLGIPMQVDAGHLLSMFDDAVIEKIYQHFFSLGGSSCNLLSTSIQAGTSGTIFLGPLSEPPGHLSSSEREIYRALIQNRLIIEEAPTAATVIADKQAELIAKIRIGLQQIIAQERAEAAQIQQQHGKRSTLEKVGAYIESGATGFGNAAWGLAVWTKDVLEVAQMLNPLRQSHRLGVATANYFWNDKSFTESGQEYVTDLQKEVVDVLGFDPSKVTRQQLDLAFDVAQIIYDDPALRGVIFRFAQDYVKAQHSLEITEIAGGGTFEIILTIVLAAITGGVGAAVSMVKNARLLRSFKKIGELMMELAKLKKLQQRVLKKRGGKAKGGSASFSDLSSSEVTVPQRSSGPPSSNSSSATSNRSSSNQSSSIADSSSEGANRSVRTNPLDGENVRFASNLDDETNNVYNSLNSQRAQLLENGELNRPWQRRNVSAASGRIIEVNSGSPADAIDNQTPWTNSVKLGNGTVVRYDSEGFPVFNDHVFIHESLTANTVKIKLTGSDLDDFRAADELAGINKAFRDEHDLTWHHHQDLGVLQLVPRSIHGPVTHTGGVSLHDQFVRLGHLPGPAYDR